jgi:hypothetical protein
VLKLICGGSFWSVLGQSEVGLKRIWLARRCKAF